MVLKNTYHGYLSRRRTALRRQILVRGTPGQDGIGSGTQIFSSRCSGPLDYEQKGGAPTGDERRGLSWSQ